MQPPKPQYRPTWIRVHQGVSIQPIALDFALFDRGGRGGLQGTEITPRFRFGCPVGHEEALFCNLRHPALFLLISATEDDGVAPEEGGKHPVATPTSM